MKFPLHRKLIYSVIVLLAFFTLLEVSARVLCFSMTADGGALPRGVKYLQRAFEQEIRDGNHLRESIAAKENRLRWDVYGEVGDRVRPHLAKRYEDKFVSLVEACREWDSKLVVLYLPIPRPGPPNAAEQWNREFFRSLTTKHGIEFWDATETLRAHPPEAISLLPVDAHLNGYGHFLVADFLEPRLARLAEVRTTVEYKAARVVLGPLQPGLNTTMKMGKPFQVRANRRGCRGTRDLKFPKQKQRILFLGDSFTFGNGVEDFECFPAVLSRRDPKREFLNAARHGFGIEEQYGIYQQRACHACADIVVLQVLDNDVPALFSPRGSEQFFGEREFLASYFTAEEMEYLKLRRYW